MSRQSSRIVNELFDHKDIVKDGYYHTQVWHNGELVWEKLPENEFIFTIIVNYSSATYGFRADGNIIVDWGDGEVESYVESDDTWYATYHNYDYKQPDYEKGYVTIKITGNLTYISFVNDYNLLTILSALPVSMSETKDFSMCFQECTSLKSIPKDMFKNCVFVTNFYQCFYGCKNITSEVPELWKRTNVEVPYSCYTGCTNAANYADIPDDWK